MPKLPTPETEASNSPESDGQALPPHVREAIEGLPEEVRRGVVAQASVHAGPLPAPWLLREYDEVVPGSGERLLKMVEKQEDHRINWEWQALIYAAQDARGGHWLGAGLMAMGLICAVALALSDKVAVGIAIGIGSPLVALAANRLFKSFTRENAAEDKLGSGSV